VSIPEIVARNWKSNPDGELLTSGKSVTSLAAVHGTPMFVYDHAVLVEKYTALRDALPSRFSICYSVKANPNAAFLKFFLEKGCGLEIASYGEFYQAEAAGCPPGNILFAGPGKTEAELSAVIERGIGEIHAESSLEVERVSRISRELGRVTRIAARVNPTEDGQGGAMRMGGKPAPFGIDEEQLEPLLHRIAGDPHLAFCGVHLFAGTQILDHDLLLTQYRKGLEIARNAAKVTGIPIHTMDFGGGLGIPYFTGDAELDLGRLSEGLQRLTAETHGEACFAHTRFIVEPGRFLSGPAGVYVSRVTDIKVSRGKKYLVLDGGMNHHLAASGNLGQVIKRNFPMAVINKLHASANETVEVVGPLCTPLDTLGRAATLPAAEVGDLVGIFQAGAYARAASPLGFLSHATPPEVWVENGQDSLIRRRGLPEDYTRDLQPLDTAVGLLA